MFLLFFSLPSNITTIISFSSVVNIINVLLIMICKIIIISSFIIIIVIKMNYTEHIHITPTVHLKLSHLTPKRNLRMYAIFKNVAFLLLQLLSLHLLLSFSI